MSLVASASPAGAALADVGPGQVLQTAVHPFDERGERTQTERLPLLEILTATWCPPCAPADRAIDRLLDDQSPALSRAADANATNGTIGLAVLAYHPWPDLEGEDPFGLPQGQDRMRSKYDAFWFPSVYVDGHLEDAPTTRSLEVEAGMEELLFQSYGGLIRKATALPPAYIMVTSWESDGRNVTVRLHLQATAAVERQVLVRPILWEDHVRFRGSNGVDTHRMTVRALADTRALPDLEPGETWTGEWRVALPAGMRFEDSGVTFIAETAWEEPRADPGVLMSMAAGTAVAAAASVFVLRRRAGRQDEERPKGGAP